MVFGGIHNDRLQLNEDTLWSGGPREWNNPDAKRHLADVRRLVLEEKNYIEADRVCRRMQGPYNESYVPLGELLLGFENPGPISEYRRELNLDTAVSRVSYRSGDAVFTRETFASAPDQAIIVRLKSNKRASLSLTLSLDSPLQHSGEPVSGGLLRIYGKAPSHVEPNYVKSDDPVVYDAADGKGMRFEAWLKVLPTGGRMGVDWITSTWNAPICHPDSHRGYGIQGIRQGTR